jgi:predicted dehydrogenase
MAGIESFSSYEAAITNLDVDLVYVSTVNSNHALIAEMALQRGFHVVVDKPAFLKLDDAIQLVSLAQSKNCCLAEAVVFSYHPRILSTKQILTAESSPVSAITAVFSFPPLPDSDFRYVRELGGGALWDLGPYAAACCRIFFEASPGEIAMRIVSWRNDVEDGFSLLATFSGGRAIVGHFGYRTSYVNRVNLIGPQMSITLDRVFSPPADLATEIVVERHTTKQTVAIEPADSFACFFSSLFRDIRENTFEHFMSDLLWDARTLDAIRKSTGQLELNR